MSSSLKENLQSAYRLALEASALSPLSYLNHVVIDRVPDPAPYRTCAEPWQWAIAQRLSPAFTYIAKGPPVPPHLNYWFTLPKGHDKSSLIARLTNWALAFASRSWNGYVCAADREQAGYLAEAMLTEARLNPWLASRLNFTNNVVRGQSSSKISIMASDAASSQGIRGDLIIFDEITHWSKPDLYKDVMSGAAKRAGIVLIITNAGIKFSWQHDAKLHAASSPLWFLYEAPGPLASWMDKDRIADISRSIPAQEARRLFTNEWIDPGEQSGYLTFPEIKKGAALGLSMGLSISTVATPGTRYIASIDYGPVKDRTCLALLHMDPSTSCVIIDRLDVLQGTRSNPVQISSVEDWLDSIRKEYPLDCVICDPYQLESTIQKYTGTLPIERWSPRGGKSNYEMACAFRSALLNNLLAWPPGIGALSTFDPISKSPVIETLEDELLMLQLKPMAYGFRVDHLPSRHDDRFVSIAMAVAHLHQSRLKRNLAPLVQGNWF